jgi:urease accessory protein
MIESAINSCHDNGWQGHLQLEFDLTKSRTILSRNRHSGPLMVQRPLYPEGDLCHTYILHPPAGIVGGDLLETEIHLRPGARALVTTPGATKFYRSKGKTAHQQQHLYVSGGASLEWFPQDTILFPGAKADIRTTIDLAPSAQFSGWEIICLGLPTNMETFNSGQVQAGLSLTRQNIPLFRDLLRVKSRKDLFRSTGLRGFSVSATFLATNCTAEMLSALRAFTGTEEKSLFGVTLIDDLLVARYLGHSTFACQALFVQIWQVLRPLILGRKACPPRIWAT